jgi:uncharacterized protein YecE (DUF72 family)
MTFYIGCAVWAHDDWAGNFYPVGTAAADRLPSYARRLTAVELNSSFYAVPPVPTVKKWAAETPESFRFSPKFPKSITHTAQLKNVDAQARTFIGTMRVLGPRLGPLMLQLPPSFGPSRIPALAQFLEGLPEGNPIAVEVRHPDFFTPEGEAELSDVLGAYKVGRVLFDSRPAHDSDSPDADDAKERKPNVPLVTDPIHPGFALVRYISSPVEAENYPFWTEWTARIAEWVDAGRDIYFYVHCPVEVHSPQFAREFYGRVRQLRPTLPPLPWDDIDLAPTVPLKQLPLF